MYRYVDAKIAALANMGGPVYWENVTGSRANGATYVNTTGKWMEVSVTASGTIWEGAASGYVNGAQVAYNSSDHVESGGNSGISFIVPPNASYTASCSPGVQRWSETR